MDVNISNCSFVVNNYSNSDSNAERRQPQPQQQQPQQQRQQDPTNNKRKAVMKPLEAFGFKRASAENTRDSIIESNFALFKKDVVNDNNNSNNTDTSNASSNSSYSNSNDADFIDINTDNGYAVSVEDDEIHIKSKGKRFDWLKFPHLVKLIHQSVIKYEYSFRKAADFCNFNYSELFTDNPISHSTIQGWYIKNSAALISSRNNNIKFDGNVQKLPKFLLKPEIKQCLEMQTSTLSRTDIAGRKRVFADYVHLETEVCNLVYQQRKRGTPINSFVARNLILGLLRSHKFPKLIDFGGDFDCSRRWTRRFLNEYCWCTYRRATNAAQKLPDDFELLWQQMVERIAVLAETYKVPKELIVNCDQTGLHYIPKSSYTYNPKGSVDVSIVGQEDKRQFTGVVAVSGSNELLPLQLIFGG